MGRPRRSRNNPPLKNTYLRYLRIRRGLTAFDVSERTGVPYRLLCQIERGEATPNEEDLHALGRFFLYTPASALLRDIPVVLPDLPSEEAGRKA